jgi:hypothetical protein
MFKKNHKTFDSLSTLSFPVYFFIKDNSGKLMRALQMSFGKA